MKRLLIANRGEIARRIVRSAHRLGVQTVAVHSEPDAQALHVREATLAVALGGSSAADSYLRADRLIEAARASGADAVHPGYGFLSENADFAQAVLDAGLCWVGPPPAAMRALGSKAAAKALALRHGVPVLPGYAGDDQRGERFAQEAQRLGYPLIVKAVAGGGGRGMRLVERADQLAAALASARDEAFAGFGQGELLIERALLRPRHVEVQVFADAHGHCLHLGERDCSVQRRHQKLIEEGPSPAVDAALRERLGAAAVALARAAGYVGAGTVEFLLDGPDFYLMEMNTRLQVEHPVTEMLTGLDLVAWQIRIARGENLPLVQEQVQVHGHAIEVRLCAEDGFFMPHSGRIAAFAEPPPQPGQRFDHALESGLVVTPHYDPLLGKLIVHAPTREEALARLAQALDATVLLGLPNNRAWLAACLRHPVFAAGAAHTGFLAEHAEPLRAAAAPPPEARLGAVLAAAYPTGAASGLPCAWARPLRWRHGDAVFDLSVLELGHGRLRVQHGERTHEALLAGGCIALDGVMWPAQALPLGEGAWQVQIGPHTVALQDLSLAPRESAQRGAAALELRAPFNGRLVAVHAQAGARVARGDTVFTLESMKIQHRLDAPRDGTVEAVCVAEGQQVAPGQVLLRFAGKP